jgi:uncharacterized protein
MHVILGINAACRKSLERASERASLCVPIIVAGAAFTSIVTKTVRLSFRFQRKRVQCPSSSRRRSLAMVEQRHTGNLGNFAEDREKASRAGHIGGEHSSRNFANDPKRASEGGHKGQPSSGNFADDFKRAAEAGHKGGQSGLRFGGDGRTVWLRSVGSDVTGTPAAVPRATLTFWLVRRTVVTVAAFFPKRASSPAYSWEAGRWR